MRIISICTLLICLIAFVSGISFRKVTEIPSAASSRAFGFDTDQDGRQNLAFGGRIQQSVQIHFWEHIGYDRYILEDTALPWSSIFDVGYLDADSLVDMVGNQCGGWDPLYVYESPTQYSNPTNVVWRDSLFYNIGGSYITDLDQDGIREILFRYGYLDQPPWWHTCVYENTSDNQYTKVWEDTIRESAYFVNGDFDQDGQIEFVTSNVYGRVYVWECIGNNNYQYVFCDTLPHGNSYDIFSAHDMDGNGKPEFMITSLFGKARLYLYEAIEDNIYEYFLVDSTGLPSNFYWSSSCCGDVDADGIEEIVWAICNRWYIYKATGVHQYQQIYSSMITSHQITVMSVYDLNENGYPEVIESWEQNTIPYSHATVIWEIEGVRLHQPNGGEVLQPGQLYPITWEKFDPPGADSFSLFVSYNNGLNYQTITTIGQSDDTMYLWTVSDTVSDSCKIMIWAYGPPRPGEQNPRGTAWDFSDSVFAIGPVGIFTDSRRQITDYSLKILQNPVTNNDIKIQYSLPKTTKVKLVLYNALGQVEGVLVDGYKSSGVYELDLNENLPSAIYFIQLTVDNKSIAKKFIKIK